MREVSHSMRHFILLIFALHLTLHAQAQPAGAGGDKAQDQSASNAEQSSSGFYLGKPTILVPLETLQEGAFSLPINLAYDAGGIKVDQACSNVGLGWAISAGGSITRLTNGSPDEFTNTYDNSGAGYIRTKSYCLTNPGHEVCPRAPSVWAAIPASFTRSSAVTAYGFAIWDIDDNRDPAPDKFIFEVGRVRFEFMFNQDGQVLCANKVKVEYNLGRRTSSRDNNIVSWVITLDDGVKYYFCETEIISEKTERRMGRTEVDNYNLAIKKWHVTKISFPDERPDIDFEYVLDTKPGDVRAYHDLMPEFYDGNGTKLYCVGEFQDNWSIVGGGYTACKIPLVSKIISGRCILQFNYNFSAARDYLVKPLTSVEVKGVNGVVVRRFVFNYSILASPWSRRRFLLDEVTTQSNQAEYGKYTFSYVKTQPYSFYYRPTVDSHTTGVDHWGYYSGTVASYNSLVQGGPVYNGTSPKNCIASRAPNPAAVQELILNKITYPTGGWVAYEYEPNDYSYVADGQIKSSAITAGGVRIKSIRRHNSFETSAAKDIVKRYEYKSLTNPALSSGVIETEPVYSFRYQPVNTSTSGKAPFSLRVHSSTPLGPIGLGYRNVTEINGDGSKTVFVFSTAIQYPHQELSSVGNGSYVINFYKAEANFIAGLSINYNGLSYIRQDHPFVSNEGRYDYMRGLLVEKHLYNNSGAEVLSEVSVYSAHEIGYTPAYSQVPIESYSQDDSKRPYEVTFAKVYDIGIGFPELTSRTSKLFDLNSSQRFRQSTITFTYDPVTHYPTARTTTAATGETETEQFVYVSNLAANVMNGAAGVMQSKYMLSRMVCSRKIRNSQAVSGYFQEYNEYGQPTKTYSLVHDILPANPVNDNKNYYYNNNHYELASEKTYDAISHRVIAEKATGKPTICTLWGSHPNGPVATIAHDALAPIQTIVSNWMSSSTTIAASTPLMQISLAAEKTLYFHVTLTKQDNSLQDVPLLLKIMPSSLDPALTSSKLYFIKNTAVLGDFAVTLPADNYQVVAVYEANHAVSTGPNQLYYKSPVQVSIRIDLGTTIRQWYCNSFEDDATAIAVAAKTGIKAHSGPFVVPAPTQTGNYALSYWERPATGGAWVFNQVTIVVPGAVTTTIGTSTTLIDEVRVTPVGAQMVSYTYDAIGGKTSETSSNGIVTAYEYDPLGRVKVIKDDKGNITKAFEYHNQ